jgi:hypothetical protein
MDDFFVRKGEQCSPFAETYENIRLSNEIVESFHKIFRDEVCPAELIVWILHDWAENFIAYRMHMLQNIFSNFNEDYVIFKALFL